MGRLGSSNPILPHQLVGGCRYSNWPSSVGPQSFLVAFYFVPLLFRIFCWYMGFCQRTESDLIFFLFLLELCGSRVERELQNVKFLSTVGFEPGTSRLLSESATTELRRMMSTECINVHLVFTCAIFRNLPVTRVRCSKLIFRELHFVNSLLSANFLIGKHQNDTNIRWQK